MEIQEKKFHHEGGQIWEETSKPPSRDIQTLAGLGSGPPALLRPDCHGGRNTQAPEVLPKLS